MTVMSGLLGRLILAAHRAAAHVQGGDIVYSRGASSVTITATFGRSQFMVESAGETRIEHTDRDFLFPADKLILAGQATVPHKGDRITVAGEVYEALPVDREQCYRCGDPQGNMIRVFTKKID